MVKISIISGFLGAGKTTFIKKLLNEGYFGKHPILIENDYGTLGIDKRVLEETGIEIHEINSGCICCSLVGNFILALEELIRKQNPEHIIIEPSGVGKLSEILDGLDDLEVPFEKYLVFTIVDVRRFYHNNLYVTDYFWDQISNADAVILSKTDSMSGKKLSEICTAIHNKIADLDVICVPWDKDYHFLLDSRSLQSVADQVVSPEKTSLDKSVPVKMLSVQKTAERNFGNKTARVMKKPFYTGISKKRSCVFESWSTETTMEYSENRLHEIIDAFEHNNRYGTIVRAKGILNYTQGSLLLDYVPGEGRISSIDQEETGQMVVIGVNLNYRALERLFLTYA